MTTHANEIRLAMAVMLPVLACVVYAGNTGPEFGYSGSIGPSNWARLSPSYKLCSTGTRQSPIDIVKREADYDPSMKNLERDYVNDNATLINNRFNIELRYDQGVGDVLVDGKNYSLLQTHWHSPAEHTIDGKRYPVELHLVHRTKEGDITVIAVLYIYGRPDPYLSQLKDAFDELEAATRRGDGAVRIPAGIVKTEALSRATRKYYRYVDSISSPPCTEGVIWNILGKVRQISMQQAEALKSPLYAYNRNNSRPLQALNGRTVRLYHSPLRSSCREAQHICIYVL